MMELPTAEEQSKIKDDFLRECHFWSTLRHPNVVQFLGIYYPSSDESVPGADPESGKRGGTLLKKVEEQKKKKKKGHNNNS